MNDKKKEILNELDLEKIPKGGKKEFWIKIISDGFSNPICIPVIVLKGIVQGPVLGLTAAVHGNELNGIPVIHRLINEIDVKELKGTIIGIPVVNVPSFFNKERRYNDGVDLNHIMPGKINGTVSQVYAYRFFEKVIRKIDYLLDLHTASSGRINSYYIRADMDIESTKILAQIQNADIIVHNPPSDGTLRGAASEIGIPSITLEVGDPNRFQKKLIRGGVDGVHNVLCHLGMIDDEIEQNEEETVMCSSSYWIYTDVGGLLTVHSDLKQVVEKDEIIASIKDIFGAKIKDFRAPERGIVVGKSVSPVNQSGGRILHLGIMKEKS